MTNSEAVDRMKYAGLFEKSGQPWPWKNYLHKVSSDTPEWLDSQGTMIQLLKRTEKRT